MKHNYQEIWSLHNYRKTLIANFINRFGDSIDMMAFTWLTYQITDSASWAAVMFGINHLPSILFMPFAGAFVEKMKKKWLIVSCDVLRGLLTAMTAMLYLSGNLSIQVLLVITFINNTFECFRIPGANGLLPYMLNKDQFEFGITLDHSIAKITELIGIAASGMLIGFLGITGAIITDMISFFLCALILSTLSIQERPSSKQDFHFQAYMSTLKEGFQYVLKHPLLMMLTFSAVMINALLVPFNSYQAAYISGTLHQNAELYSLTSLTLSFGLCFGTFLYPFLHKRYSARNIFLYLSYFIGLYYICLTFLPLLHSPVLLYPLFTLLSLLFGLCMGIAITSVNVSFMKLIDADYMARVSSLLSAASLMATPFVSFLLSGISLTLSVPEIYFIFGIFTFLIIIVMMFSTTLKQM